MLGDNIESLKKLEANSVDSVVTDPPYGLSFMNKKWDYDVPSIEFWKEVYRVLKPGGHVLSFGGTRTYHRMTVNIEDAGFEIRDQIMWLYGSGFPKSHNIGKSVDKIRGNEREVVETIKQRDFNENNGSMMTKENYKSGTVKYTNLDITKGTSEWEGWGTALKPANEPICVARKPLSEKTIAENVLRWGTGGINIDGCRVKIEGKDDRSADIRTATFGSTEYISGGNGSEPYIPSEEGRFPANIIFDEEAGQVLDEQTGMVGSASRFFYCAKVSKKERNMVKNSHPTVKPINLMAYLCRLITPPNGIVLDPFMGSGSTGIAAKLEGFNFVGMEMDEDYFKIASARVESYEKYRELKK